MDVKSPDFPGVQYRALFDLLILAMYADGHLTTVADGQLQKLLTEMGHVEEPDRQREFDAGVTRMRPFVVSINKARNQALSLADAFTSRQQQRQAYDAIEKMMTADNHITSWENTLLSELRMKFRL